MKVTLNGLKRDNPIIRVLIEEDTFETGFVSTDPKERYAVVEPIPGQLFVAVRILSREEDSLTGEYVDHWYDSGPDVPMLYQYSVSWGTIGYGFCKLKLYAPEVYGYFEKTIHRFILTGSFMKKVLKSGTAERNQAPLTERGAWFVLMTRYGGTLSSGCRFAARRNQIP